MVQWEINKKRANVQIYIVKKSNKIVFEKLVV